MTMTMPHPEPTMEPKPTSSSPGSSKRFEEEMLSPVSKLEQARQFAAEEQAKRVKAASERLTASKREPLPERVAGNEEVLVEESEVIETVVQTSSGMSIRRRLVSLFSSVSDGKEEEDGELMDEEGDVFSPTRSLLRETRDKLSEMAANGDVSTDGLPATNYHLKQMGLADDKVNIYAPLKDQHSEFRRRRDSAIRCQEKYMADGAAIEDEDYNSAEDSDYSPTAEEDDDDEEDIDTGSEDEDESEDDIDADEISRLKQDQDEYERRHGSALMKKTKRSKKSKSSVVSRMMSVVAVLVLVLAVALAIVFTEENSKHCRRISGLGASNTDVLTTVHRMGCSVVLELQALVQYLRQLVSFSS